MSEGWKFSTGLAEKFMKINIFDVKKRKREKNV